jgi:hypothetical protein
MELTHCASVKQPPAASSAHTPVVVAVTLHTLPGRAVAHVVAAFSGVHVIGAVAAVAHCVTVHPGSLLSAASVVVCSSIASNVVSVAAVSTSV